MRLPQKGAFHQELFILFCITECFLGARCGLFSDIAWRTNEIRGLLLHTFLWDIKEHKERNSYLLNH